jgi:MraZ protein
VLGRRAIGIPTATTRHSSRNLAKRGKRGDMFAGEIQCIADRTGLFVLLPAFRLAFPLDGDEAGRNIIFLKLLEGSLWLYRAREWEEKLTVMRQQLDDQQSRLFVHYMVAQGIPSEVDKKGSLAIPKELREYATIGSEPVLIGLYDRLELWSPSRWDAYLLQLEDQQELLLEKIVSLL